MSPSEHHARTRASFSRTFGHLLGLVILAILAATVFALVQSPPAVENPTADNERPARIWRSGSQMNQPVMVKAPGSGPLAKYFGAEIPLPPLPGIPADKWETAQVVNVGQKDTGAGSIPVWEVQFTDEESEAVAGENIYLVKIDTYAGGVAVPTCDMDEIFVDENGDPDPDADVYGYRYIAAGAEEAAALAVDMNADDIPDQNFNQIFTGDFINTDDVNPGMIEAFESQYGVIFYDSAGESTGPGEFYAFVSNGGTIIDPTACLAECGDGDTDSPEGCDPDTGTTSSAGLAFSESSDCNIDCTPAGCGDGVWNEAAGEECDDGSAGNHDSCTDVCEDPECGDGYVQPGEDCDDGATDDGDGCSASCTWEIGIGWDDCTNRDADLDVGNWPETICQTTCGDGVPAGLEACDQGSSNGNSDTCCTGDCSIRGSDHECRPSEGVCDVAEMCDGVTESCPSDVVSGTDLECNPSAGECDVAEMCDGSSKECPTDAFKSNSETCGENSGDECDLYEYCTGDSASCPAPDYSNNNDGCTDDGNECTDDFCETGVCTHPSKADFEDCTEGDSNECTDFVCLSGSCIDTNEPDETSCGDLTNDWCYGGICEACGDVLDLNEACDDGNETADDGCSDCAVDEGWSCTGDIGEVSVCTEDCAAGYACEDSDSSACTAAQCDENGDCQQSGSGDGWAAYASAGTSCETDDEECTADTCDGTGGCSHSSYPDGTECALGHCYMGVCGDYCGDGFTDSWEQCDEGANNGNADSCCTSTCEYVTVGVECRASADVCDVAEHCSGDSGSCPSDGYANSASSCRASVGECDLTEYCTGASASCPAEDYSNNSSTCTSDGEECTDDICANGSCVHNNVADATVCTDDDGNDCTDAYCYGGSCSDSPVIDGSSCGLSSADACYEGNCEECGSGGRGHYEACDDNNDSNSDGCDTTCNVETGWSCSGEVGEVSVCTDDCALGNTCDDTDNNDCTIAACNGVHTCEQSGSGDGWNAYASAGQACSDDNEECTFDGCDGTGGCSHSSYPDGTTCNAVPNGHCYMGVCADYCGDGVIDNWEDCDEGGNNGNADSCCTSTCEYVTVGVECRASADVCDVAEQCSGDSGSCPEDGYANSASSCRASVGECDLTEYCTGASASCPAEDYSNNSSACSTDDNECTRDWCQNGTCEHPAEADFTECTDVDGNECTDALCQSGACTDMNLVDGTSCGDLTSDWCYGGDCEVCGDQRDTNESCDDGNEVSDDGCSDCVIDAGWSCVGDVGQVSTCTEDCPVGNACEDTDGNECTSAACNDTYTCEQSGSGDGWNAYASAGQSCSDDGEWCTYDECDGMGGCSHSSQVADGTSCPNTSDGTPIDNGHCYNGVCGNYCGDGLIDSWEDCDEGEANGTITSCCSATCTFIAPSETCRESADICDVTEYCSGDSGSCPADTYADSSSVCRDSMGECDVADYCDGGSASCPSDVYADTTSSCGDSDANNCYYAYCDGLGSCNQTASSEPNGTQCGANNWCFDGTCYECGNGSPEPGEQCDNGGDNGISGCCDSVCLYEDSETLCRGSADVCDVTEYCSGDSGSCPSDGFANSASSCRATMGECDLTEYCDGSGASCPAEDYSNDYAPCSDDGNSCTDNFCSSGTCSSSNNTSSCSDGDGNTCTYGQCADGSCSAQAMSEGDSCPGGYCTSASSASIYCFAVPL